MRKIENPELAALVRKRIRLIVRPQGKISSKALSELIGLSPNYISKKLNSNSMIPIEIVNLICEHLGITIPEFFDEKYDFIPQLPTEADLHLRKALKFYTEKDKDDLAYILEHNDIETVKKLIRSFRHYTKTKD